VASPDKWLRRLGTDYVDVFQLHGVSPEGYGEARDVNAPAPLRSKSHRAQRYEPTFFRM
jgi:aryl-alcohol dehydrogenase-like predicted oxidoreductase